MSLLEACMEEIALEGLDGISPSSLWIRLMNRKRSVRLKIDDHTKRYLWRFIVRHPDISLFKLPAERSLVSDEENVNIYPVYLFSAEEMKSSQSGKIWGSCKDYFNRLDVTGLIKSDLSRFGEFENVFKIYGDGLALVASEKIRTKLLIGPGLDVDVCLNEYINSNQRYAVLERIGRGRYRGESSVGKFPLFSAFNVRPKDMSYILYQLERYKLIRKQVYTVYIDGALRFTSTSTLPMFDKPEERNASHKKMCKILQLLCKQPHKRATPTVIREAVNSKNVRRVLDVFPGVIDRLLVPVPNEKYEDYMNVLSESGKTQARLRRLGYKRGSKKRKHLSESDDDSENDEDDIVVDEPKGAMPKKPHGGDTSRYVPIPIIKQTYYAISDQITVNEHTGEWKFAEELEETEEAADAEESDEGRIDWLRRNVYRSTIFEVLRLVRLSGTHGITVKALSARLAQPSKRLFRLLDHLKKMNLLKILSINEGKIRRNLYIWPTLDHKSNADYEEFERLSGISFIHLLDHNGKVIYGDTGIKRLIYILSRLENDLILTYFQFWKDLHTKERQDGATFIVDHKTVYRAIDFLIFHGCIKTYNTVLMAAEKINKPVRFVCHRSIDSQWHPKLLEAIRSAQENFENAGAKQKGGAKDEEEAEAEESGAEEAAKYIREFEKNSDAVNSSAAKKSAKRKPKSTENDLQNVVVKKSRNKKVTMDYVIGQGLPKHADDNENSSRPIIRNKKSPITKTLSTKKQITEDLAEKLLAPHNIWVKERKRAATLIVSRQKRKQFEDPVRLSVKRKQLPGRRLRFKFNNKERHMMILVRAVAYVVLPNIRFWVDKKFVLNLLMDMFPNIGVKVYQLLRKTNRDATVVPEWYENVMLMTEQLKNCEDIQAIINSYPVQGYRTLMDKVDLFIKLLEKALNLYLNGSPALFENDNLEKVLKNYAFSVDSIDFLTKNSQDVKDIADIQAVSVSNVYLSCLSLSRRDGTLADQCKEIFKTFPMKILTSVLNKLRRDQLVTKSKPDSLKAQSSNLDPQPESQTQGDHPDESGNALFSTTYNLRRQLFFTYYYRHHFYHRFHVNMTEQMLNLYNFLLAQADSHCNVLDEVPGYVPVLISLMAQKALEFHCELPDFLISFPDGTDQNVDSAKNDISSTTESPSNDTTISDFLAQSRLESDNSTASNKIGPASIQTILLQRLRRECLEFQEKPKSAAGLSIRSNKVGVNPIRISVKCLDARNLLENEKRLKTLSIDIAQKLVVEIPPETNDSSQIWNEYRSSENLGHNCCLNYANLRQIFQVIDDGGSLGVTKPELQKQFPHISTGLDEILRRLLDDQQIFRVGSTEFRYVSYANCHWWTVRSFRMPKELRSTSEFSSFEDKKRRIRFVPRPWIRPDGTMNRPMLRWLCEGIFLRILGSPGMLNSEIYVQFDKVMQRTCLEELLEYMTDVGCIEKRVTSITTTRCSLFSTENETVEVTTYTVPVDGVTKFASLFAKTPMPDFVHADSADPTNPFYRVPKLAHFCRPPRNVEFSYE